jgi:hypothetical protein
LPLDLCAAAVHAQISAPVRVRVKQKLPSDLPDNDDAAWRTGVL